MVQSSASPSRMLPDSEHKRLGIVKPSDGWYYKAQDGPAGSIVLRPVDPDVVVAAVNMGMDISAAISEAVTEAYKLTVMTIARKMALSLVVYMGHTFALEKGWIERDMGDWVNHCCRVTLDKIYGYKVACVN